MEPIQRITINGKDMLFVVDQTTIGDISTALDHIIALQEELIGV